MSQAGLGVEGDCNLEADALSNVDLSIWRIVRLGICWIVRSSRVRLSTRKPRVRTSGQWVAMENVHVCVSSFDMTTGGDMKGDGLRTANGSLSGVAGPSGRSAVLAMSFA